MPDTVGYRSLAAADKGMAEMVAHGWLVLEFVTEVCRSMPGSDEKGAGNDRYTSTDLESICGH